MRGSFDKIIGKAIFAVYCRQNEENPHGQIFLLFDDDTYFEIYTDGDLKGAGGVDKGDLETVLNLNHPPGKGELVQTESSRHDNRYPTSSGTISYRSNPDQGTYTPPAQYGDNTSAKSANSFTKAKKDNHQN